jgi:hypothetical protein
MIEMPVAQNDGPSRGSWDQKRAKERGELTSPMGKILQLQQPRNIRIEHSENIWEDQ